MPRFAPLLTALAAAAGLSVAPVPTASSARGDWLGSERCGSCHPAELSAWRQTAHARAADRLGARPPSRCLGCHATGDAPAGAAVDLEVGCEACHGAGRHYGEDDVMRDRSLARALGLRDLSTAAARDAVCGACHRGIGTRLTAPVLTVSPKTVH
jgi:nitrate/TMAO reductase-like tetraheme cytochrome c subunit